MQKRAHGGMKIMVMAVCLAGLVGLTLLPGCGESRSESLRFKDAGLLIISIDTLRADRLGCYGNGRGLSPVLDALAQESILFEEMYANSPKTASAHMSLFTSMAPTVHGVTNFSPRQKIPLVTLADNRLTLGQVLKQQGYWNATIASGGNIQPAMGFKKGFGDHFSSELRPVKAIVKEALFVANRATHQDKPPFLFVHTYQVHGPYTPPAEYRERFASQPKGEVAPRLIANLAKLDFRQQWQGVHQGLWDHKDEFKPEDAEYLSDLYDGEVAYTDHVLQTLFDGLREKGLFDEMIIVVLSDHGEEFGEHGDYEHDQLFREHLHVPMIVRLPGGVRGGTRVKGMTSLIDVMPTLLELLDVPGPEKQMAGRSLVPAIRTGQTEDGPILAERVMYADDYQAALRSASANVIFHARDRRLEAYDLNRDPAELNDVAWKAPFFDPAGKALKSALVWVFTRREAWDEEASAQAADLDPQALEELSRLGYVVGDAGGLTLPEGSPLEGWPDGPPEEGSR